MNYLNYYLIYNQLLRNTLISFLYAAAWPFHALNYHTTNRFTEILRYTYRTS